MLIICWDIRNTSSDFIKIPKTNRYAWPSGSVLPDANVCVGQMYQKDHLSWKALKNKMIEVFSIFGQVNLARVHSVS